MAPTKTTSAIAVSGLKRSYGDKVVLDGIDLEVPGGTVFALLGPNGAGKTTMVNILSTLIRFDQGRVEVAGRDVKTDPDEVRKAIGVTGQFSAIDNLLTAEENLMLMADLHHLPKERGSLRTAELLERFELVDVADQTPATYSGGMQRRLDLAMGLIGSPKVVFLDEPTNGLDPRGRHTVWQSIRDLASEDVTVMLTTQYLEEADRLADRIALLDDGRLVAEGTPAELKRLVPGGNISLHFDDPRQLASAAGLFQPLARHDAQLSLDIPGDGGAASIRAVLDRLDQHSLQVGSLKVHTPDLDDVFFALTGRVATKEEVTS